MAITTQARRRAAYTPDVTHAPVQGPMLGRIAPKSSPMALMFSRFAAAAKKAPAASDFWKRRAAFEPRTFGNTQYNDCTRAKQAAASLRMERLESGRTPHIEDAEVIRVYLAMINERYDGQDRGAFETDALSDWRRPEKTFRDTKGRALTIDAYLRINAADQEELRHALWTVEAHGIAVCLNLPRAFKGVTPPRVWDLPEGKQPLGEYLPGSWGGHSMWARDYDERGIWLVHTWGYKDQLVTWNAAAVYLDEAHLVIDSLDYWREHKPRAAKALDLAGVRRAVNRVSSQKIR